jgi:hypothetical protein
VGDTPPWAVATLRSALLGAAGTIAVVSTDLSHYLNRAQARERDTDTAAVVARNADELQPGDACGFHPLRGLLRHAVDRDLVVEQLELATSADTGGDPRRVVGYGSFLLHEPIGESTGELRSSRRGRGPRDPGPDGDRRYGQVHRTDCPGVVGGGADDVGELTGDPEPEAVAGSGERSVSNLVSAGQDLGEDGGVARRRVPARGQQPQRPPPGQLV